MKLITKGKDRNSLSKIYDRLRRRSLRNVLVDRTRDEHNAYVRGVKDALNAVQEDTAIVAPDNADDTVTDWWLRPSVPEVFKIGRV